MSQSSYLPVMAAFWVGPYLSWIEQIGLLSFVRQGHKVILYTKGEVKNVPPGIEVRSSQDVWDPGEIKTFEREKRVTLHPATRHADFFRWYMQRETDYFYTDADRFCLKPISMFSRRELEEKGCVLNMAFHRFPKNSTTIKLMCEFLSQKYIIPPWFSPKEQKRLQQLKAEGLGVPISQMHFVAVGGPFMAWALSQTCEDINREGVVSYYMSHHQRRVGILFKPLKDFEAVLHEIDPHILIYNWTGIFNMGVEFREFLSHPPEDSWIARQAADLGIVPSDAPVLETRQKNRDYIDSLKGIKSL